MQNIFDLSKPSLRREVMLVRHAARQPQTALGWLILGVSAFAGLPVPAAIALLPCVVLFPLLAVIDARTQLLPDILTLPLLATGLLLAPWVTGSTYVGTFLGATVSGGLFYLLMTGFKAITRRDGLGFGDVKLVAALGAWVGLLGLLPLCLVASLGALVYHYITRTPRHQRIPFGPFLLIGAWLAIFLQPVFWMWLLR